MYLTLNTAPSENDQLELNLEEDDGYTFNLKKGSGFLRNGMVNIQNLNIRITKKG